jgi:hypothetical protein
MADNLDPSVPQWSSVSGTVEPPLSYKQNGFNAGYKPPAQWVNWLWNKAYLWINFLRGLLLGNLEWNHHVYCTNLSLPGVAWQIFVSHFRVFWTSTGVQTDIFETAISPTPSTVDPADLLTAAGPVYALYPEATYYIYAYRDAGTGTTLYNMSRTSPTTYGWKTGFVGTHRYVASFKTHKITAGGAPPFAVDAGSPLPFVKYGHRYSYLVNATTEPYLKTAVIAVAGPNAVNLSQWIPPASVNCKSVRYLVDWDDTTVGAVIFSVEGVPTYYLNNGPARSIFAVETPLSPSSTVSNLGFQGGTVGNFTVTVQGYEEAVP